MQRPHPLEFFVAFSQQYVASSLKSIYTLFFCRRGKHLCKADVAFTHYALQVCKLPNVENRTSNIHFVLLWNETKLIKGRTKFVRFFAALSLCYFLIGVFFKKKKDNLKEE